jgi:hypothetical protein
MLRPKRELEQKMPRPGKEFWKNYEGLGKNSRIIGPGPYR